MLVGEGLCGRSCTGLGVRQTTHALVHSPTPHGRRSVRMAPLHGTHTAHAASPQSKPAALLPTRAVSVSAMPSHSNPSQGQLAPSPEATQSHPISAPRPAASSPPCRSGPGQRQRTITHAKKSGEPATNDYDLFNLDHIKVFGVEILTWTKILPLALMFFCILFNYTLLRDVKDVLVITAQGSGPEVIPFLKAWVDLPVAIGFTVLYAKMANVMTAEALWYTIIIPFVLFFGSFAAFMYPNREFLHPTAYCDHLLSTLGPNFKGPIAILRHWTYSLFYVMAQLWGSVVVSVLFWGFANQITSVEEASQFYPLFGLGANVALIFSGQATKYFSLVRAGLPPGVDGWGVSLNGLMGMVVLSGLVSTSVYYTMQRLVVPKIPKLRIKTKRVKYSMTTQESLHFLVSSRYIREMALLVVTYGICINLVEVTWKAQLKRHYPNPTDYGVFMGNFSTATGVCTFASMLFARDIFRRFGWGVAAFIPPTMMLITGAAFFSLQLFASTFEPMLAGLGITPLFAAVLVGAAQNIFSKSSKYSLFDPCKEMAYIPLEDEVKTKGKAVIDVVCNPLGKSSGALIAQIMILRFGSVTASTPYMAAVLLVLVLVWMSAAKSLNRRFSDLCDKVKAAEAGQPVAQSSLDMTGSGVTMDEAMNRMELPLSSRSVMGSTFGSGSRGSYDEGPDAADSKYQPGTSIDTPGSTGSMDPRGGPALAKVPPAVGPAPPNEPPPSTTELPGDRGSSGTGGVGEGGTTEATGDSEGEEVGTLPSQEDSGGGKSGTVVSREGSEAGAGGTPALKGGSGSSGEGKEIAKGDGASWPQQQKNTSGLLSVDIDASNEFSI